MLDPSREQVSALPAVGDWASLRLVLHSIERLTLHRQANRRQAPATQRAETRRTCSIAAAGAADADAIRASVLVLVIFFFFFFFFLCVASQREGQPSGASQQTDAGAVPERSRPVVGLPPSGTGSTGRSRPSTASSALRRTRGCAGVHRAQIPRGSPILARGFRRQAPRRRTGAASCLQLLRGR